MSGMRISLGQMRIQLANVEANLACAADMISQASSQGADLVVLPELWSTGYDLENAGVYASGLESGIFAQVAALARANKIAVFGSCLERRGAAVMNCATYHDAAGELQAVYRKIHLFRLFDEHKWLGEGDAPAVLNLPGGQSRLEHLL